MKKAGSIVVTILAVLFWKFGLPMLQTSGEVMAGAQWNDAKGELKQGWSAETTSSLAESGIVIPNTVMNAAADCYAEKVAEYLNTTDCKYKYVKGVSSESEHLAEQEACFRKVGFEARRDAIELKCIQEHFPKDWSGFRGLLVKGITSNLISNEGIPKAEADTMGACIADVLVKVLTETGADPVNRTTEDSALWVNSADAALENNPDANAKFTAAVKRCTPAGGGAN